MSKHQQINFDFSTLKTDDGLHACMSYMQLDVFLKTLDKDLVVNETLIEVLTGLMDKLIETEKRG